MGDGIQAAKAGILEIADVFVVNKADRDGADTLRRELRSMLGARRADRGRLAAADREDGRARGRGHRRGGRGARQAPRVAGGVRRARRAATAGGDEIEAIAVTALRERLGDVHGRSALDELAATVAAGEPDPYAAAETLLAAL